MRNQLQLIIILACSLQLVACSSSKFISKQAQETILTDSNFTAAHVGISIYDASANKYLYNYQGDKYFIPASNTKLFTCYAAMKHLGDSLVGLRYNWINDTLLLQPSGDPTLLHPDFKLHNVYNFFIKQTHEIKIAKIPSLMNKGFTELGNGWAWNDYLEDYMAERSLFPIYGNIIHGSILPVSQRSRATWGFNRLVRVTPFYFDYAVNSAFSIYDPTYSENNETPSLRLKLFRKKEDNWFYIEHSSSKLPQTFSMPFSTKDWALPLTLLADSAKFKWLWIDGKFDTVRGIWKTIHSQPTDSLLKPMMHRSDNFFAEQTLLMVSNEMTGVMNDAKIIDSLLKTDYKDLPQKPRWVDGSGLSRYNLFSPQDFVTVLNKMKTDFEWNRITTILATGGEGTLTNYYINLKDRIFAKTGTLSNNIALSGFLISKKNKTIIFSVLINNHMGNTTKIRRAVEKFLSSVAEKY